MAGIIIINAESKWPVGTSMLMLVAQRTKAEILFAGDEASAKVFDDVELYNAIDLTDMSDEDFNRFSNAAQSAFQKFQESTPSELTSDMRRSWIACWQDLLDKLQSDFRYGINKGDGSQLDR